MSNAIAAYRERHQLTLQAFGQKVGVGAPAVFKWERGRVPAERVLDVERVTGIPRHELRPDLYPPPAREIVAGPRPGPLPVGERETSEAAE